VYHLPTFLPNALSMLAFTNSRAPALKMPRTALMMI